MSTSERKKAWWDKKWGKNKICGITHTRLRPGTNKRGTPYVTWINCGHGFYTGVLLEWMVHCFSVYSKPTCPICRENIKLKSS